ncbi:RyR domain-containing protein [Agromyces aurantiacus]|uniref:RyR domain-containing protein n=1 Tax=Agromyces aurantiacus TaxID=165814 RepID=A0ABV9R2G6_9MICO|nr:RyR domain-containing protein [Agromyces aurantiacus]MBM7506001.1 hypothetical protein [Agromyces aurantiacus]
MASSDPEPGAHPGPLVVVAGDVTVDWNLARRPVSAQAQSQSQSDGGRAPHRGGAALLGDLIALTAAGMPDRRPARVSPPEPFGTVAPGDGRHNHSYAVWNPAAGGDGSSAPAWRVGTLLGTDRARSDERTRQEWQRLASAAARADVIVLDDADLGFRDLSDATVWEATRARRPWIVLKQSRRIAQGPLWEHLTADAADRLIVVVAIDDLRADEIQVSRALSWERTAQDLLWELVNAPAMNALSQVAHTLVSFGPSGAMLVSRDAHAPHPSCTLFYDPAIAEGGWELEHADGVMGGTDCLVAAIACRLLGRPETPDLGGAVEDGVAAARLLHVRGYEEAGPGRTDLAFPLDAVAGALRSESEPLVAVAVPEPSADRYWTILEDRCRGALDATAADVVRRGPSAALAGVPLGRFASLTTADRSEIESFRGVAALIGEYLTSPATAPLCIGVFGPPGAGKSFGVKQVAKAVAGGRVSSALEFNLAQLGSTDELADAFHVVRDTALSGRIPLVFWDEFDSDLMGEPLGWLRHFLAPMQDGEFRHGQLTHRIGRAIFVFAGGTAARVEEFGRGLGEADFRRAKGPDFVSRLRGFVDVLGPNAHGPQDHYAVIRRALLLRAILERQAPQLFDGSRLRIDSGVLRAFLEVSEYRHGARSLEAIVASSHLAGASTYARSALPPTAQLGLHVEPEDFESLVQHPDLEGALLERLARAAHRVYEERLPGSRTLVAFDDLPSYQREQNRANVRDIPTKLARIGCVMVPASAAAAPTELTADEVERLAEDEHARWLRDLGPGWQYGATSDPERRIHEAYLPWPALPDDQRDKDRELVRRIPTIIREAGYAIVRTHRMPGAP